MTNANTKYDCPRCNGTGKTQFVHIAEGTCFRCQGTGKVNRAPAARKPAQPAEIFGGRFFETFVSPEAAEDMIAKGKANGYQIVKVHAWTNDNGTDIVTIIGKR